MQPKFNKKAWIQKRMNDKMAKREKDWNEKYRKMMKTLKIGDTVRIKNADRKGPEDKVWSSKREKTVAVERKL